MLRQENHQRGTIAPLLNMLDLSVFARDAGLEALTYVLTGNIVLALMFGIMNNVQSHIIFMRFMGSLDFFWYAAGAQICSNFGDYFGVFFAGAAFGLGNGRCW